MIDEQIEKAAQEYAQRLVNEYDQDFPELSLCDLKFDCQNAFIAGAQVALQNQWVSVEERLPEDETMVTAHSPNGRIDVPKYHVGDWVRVVSTDKHGHIGQIQETEFEYGYIYYRVSGTEGWHFLEKNLEPYTESDTSHETPVCENHSDNTSQKEVNVNCNRNLSQETANCDKQFDNILRDNFFKERRLNIAAMIEPALITNPDLWKRHGNYYRNSKENTAYSFAQLALEYADALIAVSGKGGKR